MGCGDSKVSDQSSPAGQTQQTGTGVDPLTAGPGQQVDTKFKPTKTYDKPTAVVDPQPQSRSGQQQQTPSHVFNTSSTPRRSSLQSNPKQEAEFGDIDLSDPSLNDAAVKIQSSFRGFHARKDLKQAEDQHHHQHQEPQASGLDAELADIDLADPELNKAATMIQSSYRGFHARKDMAANNKSTKSESPAGPHDTDSANAPIDLDLTDPELNQAAVKIQSGYRGFQTRKSLTKKKKGADGNYAVGVEDKRMSHQHDVMTTGTTTTEGTRDEEEERKENDAAVKIQSHYKGFKTRKDLQEGLIVDNVQPILNSRDSLSIIKKRKSSAASTIQRHFREWKASKTDALLEEAEDEEMSSSSASVGNESDKGIEVEPEEIEEGDVEEEVEQMQQHQDEEENDKTARSFTSSEMEKRQVAATKIQSNFKGFMTRKGIKDGNIVVNDHPILVSRGSIRSLDVRREQPFRDLKDNKTEASEVVPEESEEDASYKYSSSKQSSHHAPTATILEETEPKTSEYSQQMKKSGEKEATTNNQGSENPVPPKIEQENSISVASVTMPQSAVTSSLYEKLLPRDESMYTASTPGTEGRVNHEKKRQGSQADTETMGPAESVQDADKLFMPAMVEGDVSNVAVIKSSNKQEESSRHSPILELDGKQYGGFQASKEENQQQVHEQKPTQRRKSYGFQLLTSVDDSDEDDLDGLPGISAINSTDDSEDEEDESEEEEEEGMGMFEQEVADRRNSYQAVENIYMNPPPAPEDEDPRATPPKRASLMQEPNLVFDQLAQEHAATRIQSHIRGTMARRSSEYRSMSVKTKKSMPFTA